MTRQRLKLKRARRAARKRAIRKELAELSELIARETIRAAFGPCRFA